MYRQSLELLRALPPDQFEAARKIVDLGGNVWQKKPPDDPRVNMIVFSGEQFTDAELALLEPFRGKPIRDIAFVNAKVSEAGIVRTLRDFPDQKAVCVTQMPIGDLALAPLAQFRDLEDVQFSSTKITSAILPLIGQQRGLKHLSLGETAVDDTGFAHLEGLSKLEFLGLNNTIITSAALTSIGKLTNLEIMTLRGTQIDDDGLKHLTGLKRLRQLDISETKITNAGMVHIAQLSGLDKLTVTNTKVDAKGVALLQKMPKLKDVDWVDHEKATLEQKRFHGRFSLDLPANANLWKDLREQLQRGEVTIDQLIKSP